MSILDSEATRTIIKCHAPEVLAPELLAMIFHNVMALHERRPIFFLSTTDKHPPNEIDTKPLLFLTHVCRYWRDVAIGTPALWTRVHGRCQDQMDAFLERSRPLPVALFLDEEHQLVDCGGRLPEPFRSAVRSLAPRLRRLDLGMLPSLDYVVPLLASLPAPQLECLTMTSGLAGYSSLSVVSWARLLDDASSLRALALVPVVDWLPSSAFPNLTHLVLYFNPETQELLHPFELLRLLCNTPALEFLHVDVFIYEEPYMGSWHPPFDPIPLPYLRSLVFTDCPYKLLPAVLSHLSLPEDVFIRLQTITNNFPVEGPVAPLPPIAIRPVTSLDVAMQGEELLMVADGPTSGLWLEAQHDLHGLAEPQDWGEWLLGLHECLTLSHVTRLHIYVEGWETFWPAFLAHLPQVSHLAVLFGEASDERDALTGLRDSDPTAVLCDALSRDDPVLCPALGTLTIEWPHEIAQEDFLGLPLLLDMLNARSRAGHPVGRFVAQVPAESPVDPTGAMTFLELHDLARASRSRPPGTEYDLVEKPRTGKGLCAFEMRGGWRVDGEDRYWEVEERGKPNYDSVDRLWQD